MQGSRGRSGTRQTRPGLRLVELVEVLGGLTPGSPLRVAIDRIVEQGSGALVVLGAGPAVWEICSGGFVLSDSPFSPQRLAELAKMDGAIVLDDELGKILRANVHFHPESTLPTEETGSRHRTAERVARQTGKPVVAVSEERGVATLYLRDERHQLRDPVELGADLNQALVTLERFRRRLDESADRLTRFEVTDQVTYRGVVQVLHRAELVLRIGERIDRDVALLGGGGHLIALQLGDLVSGVERLRDLVVRDYVRPATDERRGEAITALEAMPAEQLVEPDRVAAALAFEHADSHARPLGVRLLAQVPRLPESVRDAAAQHFEDFQSLVVATVEQLGEVEGIGRTRALELRQLFDRLLESHGGPRPKAEG